MRPPPTRRWPLLVSWLGQTCTARHCVLDSELCNAAATDQALAVAGEH